MSAEVMEGFLCPLCMKDLGDVVQLQVHFEESHSKEDAAFVKSLKDLFGKAKSAIQSNEETTIDLVHQPKLRLVPERTNIDPVSGVRLDLYPPSSTSEAPSRSHFQHFRNIRSSRVDRYATETNRLVVRLDKLLRDMPGDLAKRREHEKDVVEWIDSDLVKLCPTCAKSFNPLRRKHHCRLCGSVMCQDCSQWVDWDLCRRLINPVSLSSYKPPLERTGGRDSRDTRSVGSPVSKPLFRLRRSNSRESVGSVSSAVGSRGGEEFRSCSYCKALLDHREKILEQQCYRPIVSQFYDSLTTYIASGEQLSPKYLNMHSSLMLGETIYNLDDANLLRVRLLKVADNIDLMSKKIESLGRDAIQTEGLSEEALPRRFRLQKQIRRAAVHFIKETLVGLPSLPSEPELLQLQAQRQAEMKRQAEEERQRAAEAKLKFQRMQEKKRSENFRLPSPGSLVGTSGFSRTGSFRSKVHHDSGFVVSSSSHELNSVNEDPMVQQINNLRAYIKQAREANMFDEVSMLESNLRMLQEEFQRQKIQEEEERKAIDIDDKMTEDKTVNGDDLDSSNPFFSTVEEASSRRDLSSLNPPSKQLSSQASLGGLRKNFNEDTKALEEGSNPFGEEDYQDEYDSSGKNPFAE